MIDRTPTHRVLLEQRHPGTRDVSALRHKLVQKMLGRHRVPDPPGTFVLTSDDAGNLAAAQDLVETVAAIGAGWRPAAGF